MENVVPGALQRLRAADIIRMVGLTAASLGQEYCRSGAVHDTKRQGARIAGVVDLPHPASNAANLSTHDVDMVPQTETRHYPVEVEIQSPTVWVSTCPCSPNTTVPCAHAAALLYEWLARPAAFVSSTVPAAQPIPRPIEHSLHSLKEREPDADTSASAKPTRTPTRPLLTQRGPAPLSSLIDILMQLGLSDLRSIAREYEIVTNGMNKQQLAETILETLKQPEAVRRVATTLEKSQRQLLAALTLAGGSMTDEDLRGLFERFSLGHPDRLQRILAILQSKALIFRTSLNSSAQQRIGLSGALLDIGWSVPAEVRTALRATVPITPFDPQQSIETYNGNTGLPIIQPAEPYSLLADLLLVARALDGYRLTQDDDWHERGPHARHADALAFSRPSSGLSVDGSVAIPSPSDMPSSSLLSTLQEFVPRSPAFLRFAVRLLQLADILHKDDGGTPYLRVLPNAAQLLLGPARAEAARDLFELWLTQSSYEELFDLQEDGLRVRCRATSLNMPILRSGELDAENSEARQSLLALLAQVPLNQWVSFPAFARFVYRLNPLFLQKRQRLFASPHWWLEREEGRPLRPLQLSDWQHGEIYYLARLLYGPLHWWGACDIALSQDGRLLGFRLTPGAGWLLNRLVPEEEPSQYDYRILADSLEVVDTEEVLVVSSPHAWPLIELMETFTEAAGVRRGRLCYRLTPRALSDALSRGYRPTYLLELLRYTAIDESQPGSPLPLMLAQLERWIASYGRARIYTGVTLLETADNLVMRELAATTALAEHTVQTIHPTLLILKKTGAEQIIDDLKRRGQAPLLHDEDLYGAK